MWTHLSAGLKKWTTNQWIRGRHLVEIKEPHAELHFEERFGLQDLQKKAKNGEATKMKP